jgi:hypothetical protein
MKLIAALAGAAIASSGCGLIDPDIADFDLSLPPKEFVVDTAQWEITAQTAEFPAIDCSGDPGICSTIASQSCTGSQCLCTGANCVGVCSVQDETCEVLVQIDLWTTINLAVEKPELAELADQPLVDITLERVWHDVLENTLNMDTPEFSLRVAPSNVTSSGSPDALLVGRIASVPQGAVFTGGVLMTSKSGEENLKMMLSDYRTPFNLIVGGSVLLGAGDMLPVGRLRAEVNVRASAGL